MTSQDNNNGNNGISNNNKSQLRVVERIKNFYAESLDAEQFFGAC